jgi:hypothetical protein
MTSDGLSPDSCRTLSKKLAPMNSAGNPLQRVANAVGYGLNSVLLTNYFRVISRARVYAAAATVPIAAKMMTGPMVCI